MHTYRYLLCDSNIDQLVKKSFQSIKIGKVAFYNQLEMPLDKAYDYTSLVMTKNMQVTDAKEGIEAFIKKQLIDYFADDESVDVKEFTVSLSITADSAINNETNNNDKNEMSLRSTEFEYEESENSSIVAVEPKVNNKNLISRKVNSAVPSKLKSLAEKTDRFTIQITSKKKLKDAQIFSKTLLKSGYDVYIQKITLDNSETWYRVRLGSYDKYNAAKRDAKLISKKLGFTVWVDFVRKEQN